MGLRPLPATEDTSAVASVVDLTEQQRLTRNAREQSERAGACWEAASEGRIVVDGAGTIDMVNQATERMFGYDRSELPGQPLEIVIPENYHRSHAEKRNGYFAKPDLRSMGTSANFFGRRKDGTQFPVEVGLNFAQIGGRGLAIGFVTDISEKRRLQEQSAALGTLVDLRRQLSTSKRREGASGVSGPLTGLDTRVMFEPAVRMAGSAAHAADGAAVWERDGRPDRDFCESAPGRYPPWSQ